MNELMNNFTNNNAVVLQQCHVEIDYEFVNCIQLRYFICCQWLENVIQMNLD